MVRLSVLLLLAARCHGGEGPARGPAERACVVTSDSFSPCLAPLERLLRANKVEYAGERDI